MAKAKKRFWLIIVLFLFIIYFFSAARPVPKETVLKAQWLVPLDSDTDIKNAESTFSIPFKLGKRFGFIDTNGNFLINLVNQNKLSIAADRWSEYEAKPEVLEIRNSNEEIVEIIENPFGYPFFLDGQTYIISSEQNALSKTNGRGSLAWTYEFASVLTCVDAAQGYVLTGSLDGTAVVLDSGGNQIFSFEPGGSRYSVISGCAFSGDAKRFALICGIDRQRFLLFERLGNTGGDYKIIYHEFLGNGFRRPVYISFIDRDRRVVFEHEQGLGIYEINSRKVYTIHVEGELTAIDDSGEQGQLFVVMSQPNSDNKKLAGINLPDKLFMNAPFKTSDVFLGRLGSLLYVGGSNRIAAFELEKQ